jgi:hypothetical protein
MLSSFSAEWLALREPFDAAARPRELVAELRVRLAHRTPLEIVDLGAGAGSNLRYLAPLLGGEQRWRLVDHDGALLEAAVVTTCAWAGAGGARVSRRDGVVSVRAAAFALELRCEQLDLRSPIVVGLTAGSLVTAAALLDLVSHDWLIALVRHCRAARATVCFALTYDGRTSCMPPEPEDAEVLELFNRHQLGDKGFGPALGPSAAAAARAALVASGYSATAAPSDWRIDAASRAMQVALLDGWRSAALGIAPERRDALTAWHARRSAHVDARRSELTIGHVDVIAWL